MSEFTVTGAGKTTSEARAKAREKVPAVTGTDTFVDESESYRIAVFSGDVVCDLHLSRVRTEGES